VGFSGIYFRDGLAYGRSSMTVLDTVSQLRETFSGQILAPGEPGYDDARRIHNGLIDKHPALIARCLHTADVVDAVNFGREEGLEISVRGGGHNVAGKAVTEGGLMIDLSLMKGIHVDPARRAARAQGGVRIREYDRATAVFGLATPSGVVSSTGIAGLTLGGGLAWLMGKYGMAVDNLLSAEVVMASGEVVTASEDADPDLFWAIRGGGGNFGVVTSFEYRLHAVGPTILGGMVLYPLGKLREMLRFYREFNREAPDELTIYAALLDPPGGDTVAALICCYCGPLDKGADVVRPLKSFAPLLQDMLGPMPYAAQQCLTDAALPAGSRYYTKGGFLADLPDAAIEVFAEYAATKPSPLSAVLIQTVRGAAGRIDPGATAFAFRRFPYAPVIVSQWLDAADSEKNVAWARDFWKALRGFAGDGVYVNDLGPDDEDRVRLAYGPNYERLAALKKKYDPDNLFRLNPNITPQG
jgi:FAD/FMN-containing dehydrogenase